MEKKRFAKEKEPTALKTAAAIPLYNVPGTLFSLAQLPSYVTRVAKFFTEVSKDTTAKLENKAICAALIPKSKARRT